MLNNFVGKKWKDIPELERESIVSRSAKGPIAFKDLAFVNDLMSEEIPSRLYFDGMYCVDCFYLFQGNGNAEIYVGPEEEIKQTISIPLPTAQAKQEN